MDRIPGANPDPYHNIGALYDLEHDPFTDDLELILQLATESSGPLLEMGCGSGRVLAHLADHEIQAVGIDVSGQMLDRARERLGKRQNGHMITLHQGDMANPGVVPGTPFGMVAYTLNALMHLDTPDDQDRSIQNAFALLHPGGTIYLDLANPAPEYLVSLGEAPILEWSTGLPNGGAVDKTAHRRIDPISQQIDTILWYDRLSPGGELSRVRSEFTLRYLHVHELSMMLTAAGFVDIAMHGSYELDRLTSASDRMIVLARTPGDDQTESDEVEVISLTRNR